MDKHPSTMKQRMLIIAAYPNTTINASCAVGPWLMEVIRSLKTFKQAGYTLTLASAQHGKAVIHSVITGKDKYKIPGWKAFRKKHLQDKVLVNLIENITDIKRIRHMNLMR